MYRYVQYMYCSCNSDLKNKSTCTDLGRLPLLPNLCPTQDCPAVNVLVIGWAPRIQLGKAKATKEAIKAYQNIVFIPQVSFT